MERHNWIKAYYASQDDGSEHEVFVRQVKSYSEYFVSDEGNRFHISELDFTQCFDESKIFNLEKFEKRNKEINQQYQESQAMYMEMLSKMDANSIADHKAKIDEREYWRKLRGETFASLRKEYRSDLEALNQTEFIINHLYDQDKEFFKDK
jgi:competence CoiA-like predicted nuclease